MKGLASVAFVILFISTTTVDGLNAFDTVDIPMEDGIDLKADVYLPIGDINNSTSYPINGFPVILIQTPYNRKLYRLGLPLGVGNDLASYSYAFVVVDWRCRFDSPCGGASPPSKGQDGNYTVEWVASQPWCDGNIGTWGPSALGNQQYATAQFNPPNLKCIVPEVSSPAQFYATYYPGGVARTEFIDQLGVLFGISALYYSIPEYNIAWESAESSTFYPQDIKVPALLVAGWFDHNINETLFMFDALQKQAPIPPHLLIGPWVHGGSGTAQVGTTQQGELSYPQAEGANAVAALRFFDHYLRGIDNGVDSEPTVKYFLPGADVWKEDDSWNPEGTTSEKSFYLQSDGSLNEDSSTAQVVTVDYSPTDPSPTVGGPTLATGLDQGPYDQVPGVESRSDAAVFSTSAFSSDVEMLGRATVVLEISATTNDTDIAVRLTDVYPDGKSYLIRDGIYRMRYLTGFRSSDATLIVPGAKYKVKIVLWDLAWTFLQGHSLRLIVTGSNYPRFNRNMNNGGVLYPGNDGDVVDNPVTTSLSIHCGSTSRVVIPIRPTSQSAGESSTASAGDAGNDGTSAACALSPFFGIIKQ